MPDLLGILKGSADIVGETIGTKSVEKVDELNKDYQSGKISEDEKTVKMNNLADNVDLSLTDFFTVPVNNRADNIKRFISEFWSKYKYILILILFVLIAYIVRSFKKVA